MDLSNPAGVALSPGTSAVIAALAGTTQPLGVRDVGRLAGVSANRAHQVIRSLAAHGVVRMESFGSRQMCSLNRAHLATGPLVDLAELRRRLFDFLAEEAASWDAPPIHASVFGSAARGDGGTDSDIDILVVRAETALAMDLSESEHRIKAATGNWPAWFLISVDDVEAALRAREPIIEEWRRDNVHLYGERLASLLRRVS